MLFFQSADRKVALVVALYALLSPVSANGQIFGNNNCHRSPRPSESCAATAAPADVAPANAAPANHEAFAAAPPTMFAAPAPTGEIAGGRNSIALPSLRISLPKLSLETPEFCLHGFTRFRRDPQMMIDGAAAPASHSNPLLFGQLTGASSQQFQSGERRPAAAAPAAPADAAAAPADGCTSIESQRVRELSRQVYELQNLVAQMNGDPSSRGSSAQTRSSQSVQAMPPAKNDPWQNSADYQLRACEQQVAGLESQISQLQQLVEKLVAQNTPESQAAPKPDPSIGTRSREVEPWSRDQEEHVDATAKLTIAAQQAQRIAELEARLEAFQRMQSAAEANISDTHDTVEALIKRDEQPARKPQPENKNKGRTSVFERVGMSLSRR